MTIKEATEIVYFLHSAYPTDRKATEQDLLARIETFSIMLADFDYSIVNLAAKQWVKSNSYLPNIKEILAACKLLKNIEQANFIEPEQLQEDQYSEQLEAFCRWIGFGSEDQQPDYEI